MSHYESDPHVEQVRIRTYRRMRKAWRIAGATGLGLLEDEFHAGGSIVDLSSRRTG